MNQVVSEAECHMVGQHEERRKAIAKKDSRDQPPGIGTFIPGKPLHKTIHHQREHQNQTGP